jgi:hypothetical protein
VSALKALAALLAVSFLLVLPLFYEPVVDRRNVIEFRNVNATHGILVRTIPAEH